MTEEEKKELESLLIELTEGELSSEQSHRLAELIRQHPAAKQQYLEYCQVHTMLAWEHGVLGDLQLPDLSDTSTSSKVPVLRIVETIGYGHRAGAGRGDLVVTMGRTIKNETRRNRRVSDPERGRQPGTVRRIV